jgi:hypothetical protein
VGRALEPILALVITNEDELGVSEDHEVGWRQAPGQGVAQECEVRAANLGLEQDVLHMCAGLDAGASVTVELVMGLGEVVEVLALGIQIDG